MRRFINELRKIIKGEFFSFGEAESIASGQRPSRHAVRCVLSRLADEGALVRCRKGLYAFGEAYRKGPVDLLTLACRMKRPSYVTTESALAHHGLIPEAVRTVQCATSTRGGRFDTAFGSVQYHVLRDFSYEGVEAMAGDSGEILMATPAKAIMDLAAVTGRKWRGLDDLKQDLRIEFDSATRERAFLRALGARNLNVWSKSTVRSKWPQ